MQSQHVAEFMHDGAALEIDQDGLQPGVIRREAGPAQRDQEFVARQLGDAGRTAGAAGELRAGHLHEAEHRLAAYVEGAARILIDAGTAGIGREVGIGSGGRRQDLRAFLKSDLMADVS